MSLAPVSGKLVTSWKHPRAGVCGLLGTSVGRRGRADLAGGTADAEEVGMPRKTYLVLDGCENEVLRALRDSV